MFTPMSVRIAVQWPTHWKHCVSKSIRAPRVRWCTAIPGGVKLQVHAHPGTDPARFLSSGPTLALAMGVREVIVTQEDSAADFTVLALQESVLDMPTVLPSPLLEWARYSWGESIPLGVTPEMSRIGWVPEESSLLIGGMPGSGKSTAVTGILAHAALDPSVILCGIDLKGGVELGPWSEVFDRLATERTEAVELLGWLLEVVKLRYKRLAAEKWKKLPPGFRRVLLVVDELAELTAGSSKEAKEATDVLRRILALGRAAGVTVVAATQKPSSDVIDTSVRDLIQARVAFRCATSDASDTVLGKGASASGSDASVIPLGSRGRALVYTDEAPVPQAVRFFYLSDGECSDLLALAVAARTVQSREYGAA